jgi:hypothetical protein
MNETFDRSYLQKTMHFNQNYDLGLDSVNPQFEEVKFSSGNLILHGFIHKPKGNAPFPAILMNHGSEHSFSVKGEQIWGNEVFAFLAKVAP